jgi:hypothetical protein
MMARAPLRAGLGIRLGTIGVIAACWACGPNWVKDAATYGQYRLPPEPAVLLSDLTAEPAHSAGFASRVVLTVCPSREV